jgi:uncharacterized OsmC-like protein
MNARITENDVETGCTLRMEWDSVSAAVDAVDSLRPLSVNAALFLDSAQWWGDDMCDHRSRAWLETALTSGDVDTLAAIEALRSKLTASNPEFARAASRRVRRRGQEWGEDIDSARFLARNPECWDRMDRDRRPSRTITIGVEIGVLGCRVRSELLLRGAAVVALADWFVAEGYGVEIKAIWHSVAIYAGNEAASGLGVVTVKPARAPLDVGSIATACCEIAFARGVLLRSRIAHATRVVPVTLGRTAACSERILTALGVDISADSDILTEADAAKWLDTAVQRFAP